MIQMGLYLATYSNDIKELKQTLIHVISKAHPPKPSEITDRQYNSCHEFLMNFDGGKIYTFNYDLILYWVYMHFMDIPNQKLKCDDGFRHPYQDEYLPPEEKRHITPLGDRHGTRAIRLLYTRCHAHF